MVDPRLALIADHLAGLDGVARERARAGAEIVASWVSFHVLVRGRPVGDRHVERILDVAVDVARGDGPLPR